MHHKWVQTTVQVNGVHLGVVLSGRTAARTLVLLHGFTGSAAGWGKLLDELIQPDLRVVALDMLGHGQSDVPDAPERYAIEHCQEDIIKVLRELGIGPGEAILLGYSMGGRIALYCAFSGFFRALILESASPGLADPTAREQRRYSDNELADRIERDGVSAFVRYWEQLPLFADQRNWPADIKKELREQRLHNRAQGLANSLRGVGSGMQPSLHDRLRQLDVPTLLIAGELDNKFSNIARQMEVLLPQAHLRIVSGAGHTVHLAQPTLFANLVRELCQSVL